MRTYPCYQLANGGLEWRIKAGAAQCHGASNSRSRWEQRYVDVQARFYGILEVTQHEPTGYTRSCSYQYINTLAPVRHRIHPLAAVV